MFSTATLARSRAPYSGILLRIVGALAVAVLGGVCLVAPPRAAPPAAALSNGVALTPPMGWKSWYGFSCDVNDGLVQAMADALVSSGLRNAGYTYVNVDDCWQGGRANDGSIAADPALFPNGIRPVVDYVHGRGLKFGLYTDAGTATCQGKPGSLGYEQQDANTYADWGVDFVKVDWCFADGLDAPFQYNKMRDALANAGATHKRPIVFSICNWGVDSPWAWGPRTGNMWRTTADTGDPDDQWPKMLDALDKNAEHAAVARPGAWNDPDALEVGLGSMSELEDRSQFSMWAMMAAPLLVSTDVRSMSEYTRATLTNADAIAVDQDPAGIQGTVVSQDPTGQLQIWSKTLAARGARAVALFNRGSKDAQIGVYWADIGLRAKSASVKDIWAGTPATIVTERYVARVPSHGVVLLKVVSSDPRAEAR